MYENVLLSACTHAWQYTFKTIFDGVGHCPTELLRFCTICKKTGKCNVDTVNINSLLNSDNTLNYFNSLFEGDRLCTPKP